MSGGQQATLLQGTVGASIGISLRSNKAAAIPITLTGLQVTLQVGSLVPSRSKALSGLQATTSTGTLTASSGGGGFSIPDITFTFGQASSHDMTQYVPNYDAGTMVLALDDDSLLPSGVTFDGTDLNYDGAGAQTTVSGLILIIIPY